MSTNSTTDTDSSSNDNIFLNFLNSLVDISFIILPNIGYLHQSLKIYKLKQSIGFSKTVPLILISSFILRVYFWLGERFGKAVLMNAILGIFTQLFLLYVLVKYSEKKKTTDLLSFKDFWNWTYYFDYILFISFFIVLLSTVSNFFGLDNTYYIFLLGTISAMIEATLDLPQVIEMCKTKNPNTISYFLVLSWFTGDLCKMTYFIARDQPKQLIGCTIFQLSTDIFVIGQIAYFKRKERKEEGITSELISGKNKEENGNKEQYSTSTNSKSDDIIL
ncbi:MAG: PQ-loop repeat-containing protein [archaeon]|nr:PQ-loop repeat-containing protein [archaeon]